METSRLQQRVLESDRLSIVLPTDEHCQRLAFSLRGADLREVERSLPPGKTAYSLIMESVAMSTYTRAGLVDGDLAAIWGVYVPGLIGTKGYPWALTTGVVDRVPKMFMKQSLREIREIRKFATELRVFVDSEYDAAVRWIERLGFDTSGRVDVQGYEFIDAKMGD